jgi:two-component system sensor histidine kinase SaeS
MKVMISKFIPGVVGLCALLGLAIVIIILLVEPTGHDIALLALYLLASGTITVSMAFATMRFGLPGRIGTIRGRLVLVCIFATLLSLGNIGFIALIMFLSTHDLGLLTGLLPFSLGLSVFFAVALSETVTRSVRDLRDAVSHLSTENLDISVSSDSQGEIRELADGFNDMAQKLKISFHRERELEKARKDLITAVSHDLRTPLSSIRAMIESINDGVVTDNETIQRYHRTIQSEVEGLGQLVSDLFDLSQIDAGTLQLHIDECQIDELISNTVEMMTPEAVNNRLELKCEINREIPPVAIDAHRIQRVLCNLVQNAIRHTPRDGSISIRTEDVGVEIQVEIADTGEGITPDDLHHLFDYSDHQIKSLKKKARGTGLGLRIAKGIVEAHGGHIWAKSELGQGSVFGFTLPKTSVKLRT